MIRIDRYLSYREMGIYFRLFYGIIFPSNVTIAQGRMTSVTADTEQKPPEKESLRISIDKQRPELRKYENLLRCMLPQSPV